jgi:phytol kinase
MTADVLLRMLIVSGAYLAMFAVGETLYRRSAAPEATRKLDHVAAGAIALTLPLLFDSPWPVIALAAPFVAFLLGTMLLGWLGSVHRVARRSIGAFLYPVAVAAAFMLAAGDYPAYAIAIMALALADPAAEVAGGRWGSRRYAAWGQAKTWEGSLAALVVTAATAIAILLLAGATLPAALATGTFAGIVVALVEGALPWGLDNVGIPLAALAALSAAGSAATGTAALLGAMGLFFLAAAATRIAGARRAAAQQLVRTDGR